MKISQRLKGLIPLVVFLLGAILMFLAAEAKSARDLVLIGAGVGAFFWYLQGKLLEALAVHFANESLNDFAGTPAHPDYVEPTQK